MSVSGRDDVDLVAAARQGDSRSMEELLRRHQGRVRSICWRITGGSRDGDDATQEALIRIVRGLDRFDGRSSFTTWIHRIATNAALDELRRRGRRPTPLAVVDDGGPGDTADPLADRDVTAAGDRMSIESALRRLPDEFRVPVVMRDVADLDYSEIADLLGVPVGTVKSRIARGRRRLVDELGNSEPARRRPIDDPPRIP